MPPAALPGAIRHVATPPPWWAAGLPKLIFVHRSCLREGVKGSLRQLKNNFEKSIQNFFSSAPDLLNTRSLRSLITKGRP